MAVKTVKIEVQKNQFKMEQMLLVGIEDMYIFT